MGRYRNAGTEPIVFRDDLPEKHHVAPGESFDVVGDQHLPYVTSLPGVDDATVPELLEIARDSGAPVTSRTRKADLVAAIDTETAAGE